MLYSVYFAREGSSYVFGIQRVAPKLDKLCRPGCGTDRTDFAHHIRPHRGGQSMYGYAGYGQSHQEYKEIKERYVRADRNELNTDQPGLINPGNYPIHEDIYRKLVHWYGISENNLVQRRFGNHKPITVQVGVCIINKYNVAALRQQAKYSFYPQNIDICFPENVGYIENELRRILHVPRNKKSRLLLGFNTTGQIPVFEVFKSRKNFFWTMPNSGFCTDGHILQQPVTFYGSTPEHTFNPGSRPWEVAVEIADAEGMWPSGIPGEPAGELAWPWGLEQSSSKHTHLQHCSSPRERNISIQAEQPREISDRGKGRVVLDIGGNRYTTSLLTLTKDPNSMLAAMFSGRHSLTKEDDGSFFIDRDGTHFRLILNYLRDGGDKFKVPDDPTILYELRTEAEYFQLLGLVDILNEYL